MWRKVKKEDLYATLSEKEVRVFGQNEAADESVIEQQLENTVSAVRGYIRSGRKCRMPNDETLLPDMLIAPAMDFAAFNLLKRFNRNPNEARTKSYEHAQSLFEKVATGAISPEDYGEEPEEVIPATTLARPSYRRRHRLLGRQHESGI